MGELAAPDPRRGKLSGLDARNEAHGGIRIGAGLFPHRHNRWQRIQRFPSRLSHEVDGVIASPAPDKIGLPLDLCPMPIRRQRKGEQGCQRGSDQREPMQEDCRQFPTPTVGHLPTGGTTTICAEGSPGFPLRKGQVSVLPAGTKRTAWVCTTASPACTPLSAEAMSLAKPIFCLPWRHRRQSGVSPASFQLGRSSAKLRRVFHKMACRKHPRHTGAG
jgi:hypothetical protein